MGSKWNYRVVRHGSGEFQIHEVYYNDYDDPISCTLKGCAPYGETVEELQRDVEKYVKALDLPPLDISIFEDDDDSIEL